MSERSVAPRTDIFAIRAQIAADSGGEGINSKAVIRCFVVGFFFLGCRKLLSVLRGSLFALERAVAVKNSLGRREKKGEGIILPLLQPLNHICTTDPRCHCRIKCGGGTPACKLSPPLYPHAEKSAARTIKSRPSAGAPYLGKKGLILKP